MTTLAVKLLFLAGYFLALVLLILALRWWAERRGW